MMAILVDVFEAFRLTDSQRKIETMSLPIPPAPTMPIVFNATGQQ